MKISIDKVDINLYNNSKEPKKEKKTKKTKKHGGYNMKKVQISIAEDLLKRIDTYAKSNYMSRSGFISMATTQQLNNFEIMRVINEIVFLLRKISENGKISKEQSKQLEDIELVMKMLSPTK